MVRAMTAASGSDRIACDAVVLGGGLVGLSMATALGQAGVSVVVVDREKPAVAAADPFDGRGSAIAWGSAQALRGIGLWAPLERHAARIEEIRVSDGDSRLFLHYDHHEVGDNPLGFIIENRFTRRALYARLAGLRAVTLLAPARAVRVARTNAGVEVGLADGRAIRARVAIAADGRESPTREAAGIGAVRWQYGQSGIVCSIRHEKPHRGMAHERFLPAGPFAVLPLPDSETGEHRSSIVWTERDELVPAMMALDDAQFAQEIAARFGDSLGAIGVAGPRWAYPLSLLQADRYTDLRLALVGDAAHVIHPIAGQGLNLGLRDVAALSECIVDAHRLGLDIGDAEVLARYARWRRFDNLALTAVTDGLVRLFSNDVAPLRLARDIGLAAVQRLPGLKRLFMRHAMGMVGDLPRLVRGEAL
jgi:2-octaprenyl-6-methoxyphenol hydroxylase